MYRKISSYETVNLNYKSTVKRPSVLNDVANEVLVNTQRPLIRCFKVWKFEELGISWVIRKNVWANRKIPALKGTL